MERTRNHFQNQEIGNINTEVEQFRLEEISAPEVNLADTVNKALTSCNVQVMSGSSSRQFPLANQEVRDVRRLLKDVLNIGDGAIALVNGKEVPEDTVLQTNDRVEFVKRAGSKGSCGFRTETS